MKQRSFPKVFLVCLFALLTFPVDRVHGAGGRIEGRVTDPKGAVIVGAAITVTDADTNQTYTAITDGQGKYKVEGLLAGTYSVTISANGFTDARRNGVRVTEGAVATIDAKLEIAPVEAAVTVGTPTKLNSDPVYQQLRQQAKNAGEFSGPFAVVTNLVLKRDAATFTLHSGEIYFAPTVEGRGVGGVFIGDGELTLTPPTEVEKHSLEIFTDQPTLDEKFDRLVLRFTDKTFDEIKSSPQAQMGTNGPQADNARDAYHSNQTLLRKTLRRNVELRTLVDLYNPNRPGFFTAFIDGRRYNKLIFQYDPLGLPIVSPEEVLLSSYGDTDGGLWTAFHRAEEIAKGTASSDEDHRIYDITHHEIDTVIHGVKLTCTDTLTIRGLDAGARVLPFRLFPSLRVTHVRDERGHDLDFIQENKNDDADFGVILPAPLEAGKSYKLTIEYGGGDALIDAGNGNYFLVPRSTWYPNNEGTAFGDRATFDLTFRHSKSIVLIGTGAIVTPPTEQDGGGVLEKWSSGDTAMAVAGFNYGNFKKKEVLDKDTGYNIEFYANDQTLSSMSEAEEIGSMSTTGMAGPMLADAQNATRLYSAYFGKLPFTRLALTQQPAPNFGQAWPTLVYMPFTAFMDSTQRYMATGNVKLATDDFFEYVAPHEIAHQWWGHMVGWKSYHDQWMSEGFAEFSASLYVQYILRDENRYIKFWNNQRDLIIQSRSQTRDKRPYTVGPVTQGYRLNSGKTGAVARFMIYPKGAYILHMLRQMMFERTKNGDQRFMAMMQDFIQSHYNQDVSTEDLKRVVDKHMTKQMDLDGNGRMDWFFKEWVYGTEMPSYQFEYHLGPGNMTLTGRVTQSGVSDNFKMLVPVYIDSGKGWVKLGSATLVGNSSVDLTDIKLPNPAKRAEICAMADVLALKIQNAK